MMLTKDGIPFKNYIGHKVVKTTENMVKALYSDQCVTFVQTGWGDYHVMVEDGLNRSVTHAVLTHDEVFDQFNINILQHAG